MTNWFKWEPRSRVKDHSARCTSLRAFDGFQVPTFPFQIDQLVNTWSKKSKISTWRQFSSSPLVTVASSSDFQRLHNAISANLAKINSNSAFRLEKFFIWSKNSLFGFQQRIWKISFRRSALRRTANRYATDSENACSFVLRKPTFRFSLRLQNETKTLMQQTNDALQQLKDIRVTTEADQVRKREKSISHRSGRVGVLFSRGKNER